MNEHAAAPSDFALARGLARRLPCFYGWVIVAIGFICIFFTGATSFWGLPIFVGPMHDDTGWSHGSIFGGLAVRNITGAFGGFFLGSFVDKRHGPQAILLGCVLIDGLSMASLRWAQSPAQFIVLYGLIGGVGSAGTRIIQATLASKWFVIRRGAAVGISSTGGGASALVMVPLIALLVDALGWRDAWTVLAGIVVGCLVLLVPFAVRAPEDIGLLPDDGATGTPGRTRVTAATERSYTLREAMRTWQLWLITLSLLFGSYSLNTHSVVLVPYFEEIGFSAAVAASAISVYGLASVSSRFLWGSIADRFTVRPALFAQGLLSGVCALSMLAISSQASLYAATAYAGVILGGFSTLQSLIWPEFFGRRHIGSIIGFTQLFTTFAYGAGPFLAGLMHDSTGSYETTLWLMVASWSACGVVALCVRRLRDAEPAIAEAAT